MASTSENVTRRWADEEEIVGGQPSIDATSELQGAPGASAPTTVEETTGATQAGTSKAQAKGKSVGGRRNDARGPKSSVPRSPQGVWAKKPVAQGGAVASAVAPSTGEDSSRTPSSGTPAVQGKSVRPGASQPQDGRRNKSDRPHIHPGSENAGGHAACHAGRSQKGHSLCCGGESCRFLKGGCFGAHSIKDYITAHSNMGMDFGTPKGLCPCGTSEACAAYFVGAPHGIICPNRLHRGQLLLTLDGTKVDASAVFDALNVVPSAFHQAPNTYVSNAAKREAEKTAKAKAEKAAAEAREAEAEKLKADAEKQKAEAEKLKAALAAAQAAARGADHARNCAASANREVDTLQWRLQQAETALASVGLYRTQ